MSDAQPMLYQIRIKGHLDRRWADRFEGFAIVLEDNGETSLTGWVIDQAALYSVLRMVRDLGTPLISLISIDPTQANGGVAKP